MEPSLDPRTREIFLEAFKALESARVPFMVAGAFAMNHYSGIWRNTKDLDIFCEPNWARSALDALAAHGFTTSMEEEHWLGKAKKHGAMVDMIWGGGNWATFVDEHWTAHARKGRILGHEVMIAPPDDIILSKAWVAGRERYDGTDIVHLIHSCGRSFDWDDVVSRFGDHWGLLLQYLVLYRFAYPAERDVVPARVIHELAARIGTEAEVADGLSFRGPLVDRYAYLHDLRYEGRTDPGEIMAARAGFPVAAVQRRRALDAAKLDAGLVYGEPCQHGKSSIDDEQEPAVTTSRSAAESASAFD